jgi:heterotetrameric sarcosine oxidase delta subunit
MLRVPCPWCGPRNADEFRFVGDAKERPDAPTATPEEWRAYLYLERNEAGWVTESWYHRAGCRRYFVAERHRTSNDFRDSRPPAAQQRMADGQ